MKVSSYLQRFDNIELAVRTRGSGIPLIWGHSLLGSIRVDDQADIWQWDEIEKHAQLVRYDARGHGNSDGSYAAKDYRWDHLAGDMLSVAQSLDTGPNSQGYVLGGASMGCATALEAALKAPEEVAGLVLVLPPTAWRGRRKQARLYRRQAWMSAALGATPYRLLDLIPKNTSEDAKRRLSATMARELSHANPLYVQAALQGAALSNLPTKRKLATLDIPTIIFTWRDDKTYPLSTANTLADALPNVHSYNIAESDDISEWTPKLCQFLDQIDANKRKKYAA
ncbi:MAG: alpha/beta hydrolase [Pseudomonadales bacterium]